MPVVTRAGSRKQAQNVRKYAKRSRPSNLKQPVSIKRPPAKPRQIRSSHILQSKPWQSSAQIARKGVPPNLTRVFSRTRRRRQPGRVSRRVNLGGNAMAGQVEPVLSEEAMRFMLALSIPTLPSGCDWIQVENLRYLNWEINLRFSFDSLKPNGLHHANNRLRLTDVAQIERDAEPKTSLHQDVGEDLETERLRIRNRLKLGSFQILTNWTPIQGVEPLESIRVREGTVDSSPPERKEPPSRGGDLKSRIAEMFRSEVGGAYLGTRRAESLPDVPLSPVQHHLCQSQPEPLNGGGSVHSTEASRSSRSSHNGSISTESRRTGLVSDSDSINTVHTDSPGPPPYEETTIKFTPTEHIGINIRHDWDMVVVMEPSPFNWTYLKPHNLPFRERSRHLKPFPTNPSTLILDNSSSGAAARFMSLHAKDTPNNQECGAGRMIGRLFADLISSELIPASCLLRKNTLPAWRTSLEPVTLDVGCVPTQGALAWDEQVAPLLLAAQFSENIGGHDQKASQQLACGFHPTLIVLILYYLDARSRLAKGGQLPSWMVVYGIIYTTSGFSIHEHYPVFRTSENGSGGWWGAASSWAVQFEDVFHRPSPYRSQSMAALSRICGHTQFVLENLVNWDGYERVIRSRFLK